MPSLESKACVECGTEFKGRADKRYCSDQCRTSYNNKVNSDETSYMRKVNNILRRNRRTLVELNPEGKSKVAKRKLHEKGFDFGYYTSTYKTKDGTQYFFCYEQGYLPIDQDHLLLVVKKEFA